ncbi:MAG TPA: PaaI family thioesterase [Deltaproteobacteria bacterium]|nr:PaaI family thioesterase [Deltaproteobacteria bacterium]
MKKLNPDHAAAVQKSINNCPYFSLLSMDIISLEAGRSVLKIEVQEKHLQPYGMVHGGVYSSMMDAACFWAGYTEIEEPFGLTTVEMKLNYLAPASSGIFIAKGKVLKTGKTLCLSEATIIDQKNRLLAHGTATMMVLQSLQIQGQSSLPLKFLD